MKISDLVAEKFAGASKFQKIPLLSLISPTSARSPTSEDLAGHARAQRLAYDCAETIGAMVRPGWTEKRAAALMDTFLRDHGVRAFFHRSFAWWGARSRFQAFKKSTDFFSGDRVLEESDVFILDTAPILDGYVADIGFTDSLFPNAGLKAARARLAQFRKDLPKYFKSSMSTAEIWRKIDEETRASGFDNIHAMYPFSVLGHRVYKVPFSGLPGLLYPFGFHAYWAGSTRGLLPELLSPHHRGEKTGLWAIEPHIGGNGFGAKFEEILVVDPQDARGAWWLSDDVPHVTPKSKRKGLHS